MERLNKGPSRVGGAKVRVVPERPRSFDHRKGDKDQFHLLRATTMGKGCLKGGGEKGDGLQGKSCWVRLNCISASLSRCRSRGGGGILVFESSP